MVDGPGHRCAVCSKSYKRPEHLRRHQDSHSTERRHQCTLCGSTFQRADVLTRHLKTCDGERNAITSKRRACDQCVRQKKACNSLQPCDQCLKKNVPCYYPSQSAMNHSMASFEAELRTPDPHAHATNCLAVGSSIIGDWTFDNLSVGGFSVGADPEFSDSSNMDWRDFLVMEEGLMAPGDPYLDSDNQQPFQFLDRFTSRTGLISSFECGTQQQRQQVLANFIASQEPAEKRTHQSIWPDARKGQLPLDGSTSTTFPVAATAPDGGSFALDPLQWQTHRIILLVKEVITIKPRNSTVALTWSSALEQMCLQFFSPFNLRKYLEMYWTIWHPNVNFIHRPTFDPGTCKPVLLASMAIIGACVSPDDSDNDSSKIWFECMEEMVFTDADLSMDSLSFGNSQFFDPLLNQAKVQALQAAYIVCLYQNWEGTDLSKRRIRRYRFGTVIAAARDIGLSAARHQNYGRSECTFEWATFVAKEELIRVFLWIFLLDTAFVIFNNMPPRMVIKEATMHLACPEACFQAISAAECFDQVRRWVVEASSVSLVPFRSVLESLCRKDLGQNTCKAFAYLGPLNLFALTSAFHALVFQYQNSFGGSSQLIPIQHALKNWKDIWQVYLDAFSLSAPHNMAANRDLPTDNMGLRVGFSSHAAEFWLLSSLIMDHICADNNQNHRIGSAQGPTEIELAADGPPEPILHEYDQTSMRQVNDLISVFQKVQIQ